MELTKKLEQITAKLRRVGEKIANLEQANANLLAENEQLKNELAQRNTDAKALQDKLERIQLRSTEVEEGVRPELNREIRQQIDQYLTEIDQCIEWLKQQ